MNPPSSSSSGMGILAGLADITVILDRQVDARNITQMFNYLENFPPSGFHPLLTNVTLVPAQELRTGNILPLLQGPDWDDASIVGFLSSCPRSFVWSNYDPANKRHRHASFGFHHT